MKNKYNTSPWCKNNKEKNWHVWNPNIVRNDKQYRKITQIKSISSKQDSINYVKQGK
jgi:hypothetical protein